MSDPLGESYTELIEAARRVREQAYVPYSHFPVGAAILAADGRVFTGCNVENASYGLTLCAERNALAQAVAQGARVFEAIAVVTENGVSPCGACRQVLSEFGAEMLVVMVDQHGKQARHRIAELLPVAFGPGHLAPAME